jgi:hypothetical protein
MPAHYLNARTVLPPEVMCAVSKAIGGRCAFLWVPAKRNLGREQRDRLVIAMHQEGANAATIADECFVSTRTVFRILARERAARAPSAIAPEQMRQPLDQ